jgi:hypothetical protein
LATLGLAAKQSATFSAETIVELLNGVKSAIGARLIHEGVSHIGVAEAQGYLDEVLSEFTESLFSSRGAPLAPK